VIEVHVDDTATPPPVNDFVQPVYEVEHPAPREERGPAPAVAGAGTRGGRDGRRGPRSEPAGARGASRRQRGGRGGRERGPALEPGDFEKFAKPVVMPQQSAESEAALKVRDWCEEILDLS